MTPNEFVMWLDGYIAGGGQDMAAVVEKSKGIRAETPPYPIPAQPATPIWDLPLIRWRVTPSDGTNPWRMPCDVKPYRMEDGGTLCQNIDTQYTVS